MSRDPSAAFQSALAGRHLEQVVFAELQFASGTSRLCTREKDMDWNGSTWLGKGRVGSIEAIGEGAQLEARQIAMSLSGIPSGVLATALDPAEYKNRLAKLWFGLLEQPTYLSLPGTSGNYASTPDSAALNGVGDLDIRMKVSLDDWTPDASGRFIHKRGPVTTSWDFFMESTDRLALYTGTAGWPIATAAVPFSDGEAGWIRVTRRASDARVQFFTSTDGQSWTQLGTDLTDSTAGALAVTNNPVEIGQLVSANNLAGKVYYAEVRNGIDGDVVAKFDPKLMVAGQTSAQMPTGEVWTVNQSGSTPAQIVADPYEIVADPVGPFTYRMDSLEFEVGETNSVRLTAFSRLEDWQRPRVRRYNDSDQRAVYPDDRFFEYAEQLVTATLIW